MNYLVTDVAETTKKLVTVTDKRCLSERCSKLFAVPESCLKLEMYVETFEEYVDFDDVTALLDNAKLCVVDERAQAANASTSQLPPSDNGSVASVSNTSTLPVVDLSAGYVK